MTGLEITLAGRRRWHLLSSLHGTSGGERPDRLEANAFQVTSEDLKPWSINRFSGRQRRSVPLFGVTGSIDIEGPWSQAGEWTQYIHLIHLGKHASFGFGRTNWKQVD